MWTGTQRPFGVRTELAEAFRIPETSVRVIVPDMGSGYGGKHTGEAAIEAARLAKAAGAPGQAGVDPRRRVHVGYFRPAGVIDIKSGVDANGTIVLWAVRQLELGERRHPDRPTTSRRRRRRFHT